MNKQLKYKKALEYEIFTKEEYGFAGEKIKNAKCIFDIGGHIGYFSKRCISLNTNTKIHYFEPVLEFYNEAKDLIGNNRNIILNNCGISSKNEIGTIFLNSEKTMQSSKYQSFLNPNGREIQAKFITLKKYLLQNHIEKIDVLKMDVEGMEFEVLSSWGDFERERIDNLVTEIHLLNDKMRFQRNQIFKRIQNIFSNIEIINGGYREEIFLLQANKKSGF